MDNGRILKHALSGEVKRMVLRECLNRYRNELMDDAERMQLQDRIKWIKRQLRLA